MPSLSDAEKKARKRALYEKNKSLYGTEMAQALLGEVQRRCTICGVDKLLTAFHKQATGKYGKNSKCKECVCELERVRKSTPEGRAKFNEYSRRHRNNPAFAEKHRSYRLTPKGLWYTYKAGAKKRDLEFVFDLETFTATFWQQPCTYCGDGIKTAGVDRIDSSVGYTLANSVPCCSMCNWMKRSFSKESFIAKCKQIVDYCSKEGIAKEGAADAHRIIEKEVDDGSTPQVEVADE